jgi:chromosome segregation protein
VFLKSLTLRGFKSFADKTVLEFEPGVMVVVGPNGSGKSNLVDAVAWVLGAQGPRTLRGGKMDDVIFAGTPDRPALGRAEVSLTIDNSSNLLPIEFTEVTITRTLFRNGDSEYAINGAPCRLLDIQELLSDTGIGRQQHVIVGQGQLDAVLTSRPEDRRAVIEEAAGVLKYRKRRERAERRLESTEGNLLRLNDLLREVRRGLTPLQKQADAARRHDGLVAELRAIRLHLVGHELAGLQAKTERLRDLGTELSRTEAVIQARLRELDIAVLDAEQALTDAGHGDVADALVRVESLRERARGLRALLAEKRRGLERELAAAADEGVVETLVADAGALRAELVGVERDAADLAERRSGVDHAAAPADPLRHAEADAALAAAESHWRECENDAGRWQARAEALAQAIDSVRPEVDLAALDGIDGIAGSLLDHLEIEVGAEAAVAAALGDAMHAIVVDGNPAARRAVERLAGGDAQALLLVLDDRVIASPSRLAPTPGGHLPQDLRPAHAAPAPGGAVPSGTKALAGCVRSALPGLQATLARLLTGVVLADGDWRTAVDVAIEHPELTVMTATGDRFGGGAPWRLGGEPVSGITRAALDEAEDQKIRAIDARAVAEQTVAAARQAVEESRSQAAAVAGVRRELEMRAATLDERRAVLSARLAGVEDRLARDPEAKATAERYRSALVAKEHAFGEVAERLDSQSSTIDEVLDRLREERRRQAERASAAGGQLEALRTERSGLEGELTGVREKQQRREVDDAENRMRLEAVVERIRTDFDCEPALALDAPAPEVPEGTTRAGRARDLDRELRLMGPINPLALEEYDALLERHDFLSQQLEDVKNSRRELQRVIKAVDKEIVTVFSAAFDDVQENFTQLFTTLFPGGSGRVFLTDPQDLLNTGIEMEARPSGKNTRRLSLLSGGERSLTAMAFLFSVFRARPSPFYLLDEVEAALDDVNLHRFLDLVHEFRDEAQLVIVSHQKRTMEAGDCLYGVSMAPGGSSRVVSQRMRGEPEGGNESESEVILT